MNNIILLKLCKDDFDNKKLQFWGGSYSARAHDKINL